MLHLAAVLSALAMVGASLVLLKQSIGSNIKRASISLSTGDNDITHSRAMGVTAPIRIFVNYLLMSGILGSFELDWGASLKTLFSIQQTASGGVPPIFGCMGFSMPNQILGSYGIVLAILIFPLTCLAGWKLFVYLQLITPEDETKMTIWGASPSQFYVTGVFVLTWLIWPLLVTQALKPLDCSTEVDGVRYLSSDLSVKCEGEEYDRLFAFAITMLATVIPGFPLAITWVLYRSRNDLDDAKFQSWWFYLYGMYSERW
jgi:hypothetical protein